MNYYKVGKIMTTHGIKGEVKVQNYSDFDRYEKDTLLYVYFQNKYIPLTVKSSREFPKGMLVTFKDHEDINLILKYHSCDLYISEEDREELDGEYYFSDLMGMDIVNQNNEARGKVIDILDYPQGSILVSDYKGRRSTIPYREEFIIEISDVIKIKEIEGLFGED